MCRLLSHENCCKPHQGEGNRELTAQPPWGQVAHRNACDVSGVYVIQDMVEPSAQCIQGLSSWTGSKPPCCDPCLPRLSQDMRYVAPFSTSRLCQVIQAGRQASDQNTVLLRVWLALPQSEQLWLQPGRVRGLLIDDLSLEERSETYALAVNVQQFVGTLSARAGWGSAGIIETHSPAGPGWQVTA